MPHQTTRDECRRRTRERSLGSFSECPETDTTRQCPRPAGRPKRKPTRTRAKRDEPSIRCSAAAREGEHTNTPIIHSYQRTPFASISPQRQCAHRNQKPYHVARVHQRRLKQQLGHREPIGANLNGATVGQLVRGRRNRVQRGARLDRGFADAATRFFDVADQLLRQPR